MKKLIAIFLFLILSHLSFSQVYRSKENIQYWKNRLPYPGYWQQDVHYNIKADVDEKSNIISATESLTYYNNSPDTLHFVYFHLYQNAFQPGSYYDNMTHENGVTPKYGKYETAKKNTKLLTLTSNGIELKKEEDNTIVKVYLSKPLFPNDSVSFDITFKSYFDAGSQKRRMKYFSVFGNKHFDGVHWYPRIAVYDRKFGWETDQHMEKEFYGNFGTYDVELTFANNYIVEATGVLQNENEMLPDSLRKRLDIRNFKDKPLYSPPSVIIPYDTSANSRKTWKYHAFNVHDFAFTADPTYRIGEVDWNGIRCISLAEEPNAAGWQNAAEYLSKIIKVYSEDIGMFIYPKMIVADARDGMEYPMLTLDGGLDPTYRDLFTHEVGHNWFFGMVGTNETYRAYMDEGFTQFLTCWAYEKIDGKFRITNPPESNYVKRYTEPDYIRNSEVYLGYILPAAKGEETNISRHSNDFNTALRHGGGYSQVYFKTAVMLYNLQYVLGNDLFLDAMKHYFNQWKLCHPYPEDFRNSIIQYTHVDLNWFFDEWLETSKIIDYKIKSVKAKSDSGRYEITFRRKGKMHMPVDFSVTDNRDSIHNFHIPNTWFVKKTDATVLPKWFGWDKIQPMYTATVTIPQGIKSVEIDTSNRLADINMRNNRSPRVRNYSFDSQIKNMPDWHHYELFARPDIWYNSYDGIKAGANLNGNFLNTFDLFDATLWINSGFIQNLPNNRGGKNDFNTISYRFIYKTATNNISRNSNLFTSFKHLDGLNSFLAGFDKSFGNNNKYTFFVKAMKRPNVLDLNYLLYPKEWDVEKMNNTINFSCDHLYSYKKGVGKVNVSLKSSTLLSNYDYSNISLTSINKNKLGKFNLNTRVYVQYGTGRNTPKESALYLAGANPEEMMDNKFIRSKAFIPTEWTGYDVTTNHFQAGGGLNLRGYAGYLAPQENNDGNIYYTYRSKSGASINAELEFDQLFNFIRIVDQNKAIRWVLNTFKMNTYLFGDAGVMSYSYGQNELLHLGSLRMDAGVGAALTIRKWGYLQKIDPLTIRFDMPFFLNKTPATENNYMKFRWLIGISRAF